MTKAAGSRPRGLCAGAHTPLPQQGYLDVWVGQSEAELWPAALVQRCDPAEAALPI